MARGEICTSKGCDYFQTGITPEHCCVMCGKEARKHGVRCQRLTVAADLDSQAESGDFDVAVREHLSGKNGIYVGDLPDEIKAKRVPKSRGIMQACRKVKQLYISCDDAAYVFEDVLVETFDPNLIRFPAHDKQEWKTPVAKYWKMRKRGDHNWTYTWAFSRLNVNGAVFARCKVVVNGNTGDTIRAYAHNDAMELAEAAAMGEIVTRWNMREKEFTEDGSSVSDHEGMLEKLEDYPEETLPEAIATLVSFKTAPPEKYKMMILQLALKSERSCFAQVVLAMSPKLVSGKFYAELLKKLATELVNSTISAGQAEHAIWNMSMLFTDLSPYTKKMLDAVIGEEIESSRSGRSFSSSFDIRMGNEDKKAVPAERQIDALLSLENGKCFDPTVAKICKDSWIVCENARKIALEDAEVVMREYRKLCNKQPPRSALVAESKIPLTASQIKVVEASATNTITCVRGPPGTGKTHTACAVINNWVQNDLRVLVVAQSNAACEHLGNQLSRLGVDAVRLGASVSSDTLLSQAVFVEKLEDTLENFIAETKKEKPKLMPFLKTVVERAKVVITSCIAAGHPGLLSSVRFGRVLMEEAGQITEPTALVPLWWGAKGVCLIGDERQLPPTVLGVDLNNPLKKSLFERLIVSGVVSEAAGTFLKLDVQHRMHPSLAEFPRCVTYSDQELYDDPSVHKERPQIPGFAWPNDHRAVFVDVSGRETQNSKRSFQNSLEASVVESLVKHFVYNARVQQEDIAVVSGYSAQVELLKGFCRGIGCSNVKVATADSFQGSEKPLIIFSTVRNGHDVGFLSSMQRCNVIMTRAQRGLIVVGSRGTLMNEPNYWKRWIEHVESRQCVIPMHKLPAFMVSPATPRSDQSTVQSTRPARPTCCAPTLPAKVRRQHTQHDPSIQAIVSENGVPTPFGQRYLVPSARDEPNERHVIAPQVPNGRHVIAPQVPNGRHVIAPQVPNERHVIAPQVPNGRHVIAPHVPNGRIEKANSREFALEQPNEWYERAPQAYASEQTDASQDISVCAPAREQPRERYERAPQVSAWEQANESGEYSNSLEFAWEQPNKCHAKLTVPASEQPNEWREKALPASARNEPNEWCDKTSPGPSQWDGPNVRDRRNSQIFACDESIEWIGRAPCVTARGQPTLRRKQAKSQVSVSEPNPNKWYEEADSPVPSGEPPRAWHEEATTEVIGWEPGNEWHEEASTEGIAWAQPNEWQEDVNSQVVSGWEQPNEWQEEVNSQVVSGWDPANEWHERATQVSAGEQANGSGEYSNSQEFAWEKPNERHVKLTVPASEQPHEWREKAPHASAFDETDEWQGKSIRASRWEPSNEWHERAPYTSGFEQTDVWQDKSIRESTWEQPNEWREKAPHGPAFEQADVWQGKSTRASAWGEPNEWYERAPRASAFKQRDMWQDKSKCASAWEQSNEWHERVPPVSASEQADGRGENANSQEFARGGANDWHANPIRVSAWNQPNEWYAKSACVSTWDGADDCDAKSTRFSASGKPNERGENTTSQEFVRDGASEWLGNATQACASDRHKILRGESLAPPCMPRHVVSWARHESPRRSPKQMPSKPAECTTTRETLPGGKDTACLWEEEYSVTTACMEIRRTNECFRSFRHVSGML